MASRASESVSLPSARSPRMSGRASWRARQPRSARFAALLLACGLVAAACSAASGNPEPTPADFTSITASLRTQGIAIDHVVSGEAGCNDPTLVPTAISFDARGVDQASPVRVHLYIFRDGSVYTRLRSEVDTCARSYIADPSTYATVDQSPYVAAGKGPWGEKFKTALRTGLAEAVPPDTTGP